MLWVFEKLESQSLGLGFKGLNFWEIHKRINDPDGTKGKGNDNERLQIQETLWKEKLVWVYHLQKQRKNPEPNCLKWVICIRSPSRSNQRYAFDIRKLVVWKQRCWCWIQHLII